MLFQTALFPDSSVKLDFTSSSSRMDVSSQPWGAESRPGLPGHVPGSLGTTRAGNSLGSCRYLGRVRRCISSFSRPSRPLSVDRPWKSHPGFPSPSLPPPFSLLSGPDMILAGGWHCLPGWEISACFQFNASPVEKRCITGFI